MHQTFLYLLTLISFQLNSIESQRFDQEIDASNPNYILLNEGLFRAANEIREQYNLPLFKKNTLLQKTAESHAFQMVSQNFYSHKNPRDSRLRNLIDRVKYTGGGKMEFNYLAENIAHYDILATESMFCLRKTPEGKYFYYDCNTRKRIPIFTYKGLARAVLRDWMNSESHRENLIDPTYKYLGTAAQLSEKPYFTKNPPFARLVQNFGG
jgi:uncharacterized protein YkwD